ncbi:MAG: hypothetical protein LBF09_00725 [Odoribacteraceae bacterium]|nr:hypothetical protein [Odoribacteraceae bacterium]
MTGGSNGNRYPAGHGSNKQGRGAMSPPCPVHRRRGFIAPAGCSEARHGKFRNSSRDAQKLVVEVSER